MNPWIEVFGRLHPLLLHLPIGLLVALGALELVWLRQPAGRARGLLAALTALAAVGTAATGWVLGHDADHPSTDTLERHEWLGISVAVVCLLLAALARRADTRPAAYRALLAVALLLLLPTGHLGASMTHGEDFLFEPLHREAAPASVPATASTTAPETAPAEKPDATAAPPAAPVAAYAEVIAPLLQARCGACHNEQRRKGRLVLVTPDGLREGGRDGPAFVAGQPSQSEMLRRVRLPLDDEDHMPPEGKPQPTAEEIATLETWIAAGAPFDGSVEGLHGTTAPAAAQPAAPAVPADKPAGLAPPPAADPAALGRLRDALVHVEPAEPGADLLWVDFAAIAPTLTDAQALELLEPLREQVAEVSVARAGVGDALLPLLARCPQLWRLDLSRTQLSSAGLARLAGHPRLEELVLVGTTLDDSAVDTLASLPALRRVRLWGAGLSDAAVERLRVARPALDVDAGEPRDSQALETEPPVAVGAPAVPPVNTLCPVSGRAVDSAFTLEHEGRVIGFCCDKCPESFKADPTAYLGKLP